MSTFNVTRRAFARERITITNGAVKKLTAATYNDASNADPNLGNSEGVGNKRRRATAAAISLMVGTGQISFSEEGTDPTGATDGTGVGRTAQGGDTIVLESYEAIVKFKAIALAANAIAEVVFYR